MDVNIHVIKANPCGNTTLIIDGPVPPSFYASVALRLMNAPGTEAEQAGFICPPVSGGLSRLVMSGNEFCGNAARAFGFVLAKQRNIQKGILPVELSGCSGMIQTYIDQDKGEAFADMPLPEKIIPFCFSDALGVRPVVCFEGIWHVLLQGRKIQEKEYHSVIQQIYEKCEPEALGILYLNDDYSSLTPVVYVHRTGTIYHESSCGSGTTAIASFIAEQNSFVDCVKIRQPAGELTVAIERKNSRVCGLRMGGSVSVDAETDMCVEI